MKTCKKCGQSKEAEMFSKHPNYQDGRDCTCKECRNQQAKDRRRNAPPRGVYLNRGEVYPGGSECLAGIQPRELIRQLQFLGYTGELMPPQQTIKL